MDGARSALDFAPNGRTAPITSRVQKQRGIDQIGFELGEKANKNSSPPARPATHSRSNSSRRTSERTQTPTQMRTRSKNVEEVSLTPEEKATLGANSSLLGAITQQPQCYTCKRGFRKSSAASNKLKQCRECPNFVHPTCDSAFVFDEADGTYCCPECASPNVSGSSEFILDGSMEVEDEQKTEDSEKKFDFEPQNLDDVMDFEPSSSKSPAEEKKELKTTPTPVSSESKVPTAPSDSIAANVQQRKRTRKPRQTTSPQPYSRRSASAASEDRHSPLLKRQLLSSQPSTSTAIQNIQGLFNELVDPESESEPSGSPDSFAGNSSNARSRINDDMDEYKPTKATRARRTDASNGATRSKGKQKSKPAQQKPSMRTRSGGKPASCITPYGMIAPEKTSRGRKNGKGKSQRGRRAAVQQPTFQPPPRIVPEPKTEQRNRTLSKARSNEEADYIRTAIVTSCDDKFMDSVCLCLICGSIGKDSEATMITCTSCAQSYHTYCVNMHEKLNNTVLNRGWRCLDCTACEGCGTDKDEQNLLLCEECDISYHIYCLDPPLKAIPSGPWRCKWCATCCRCHKEVQSGLDLSKLEGLCESCYSLRKCPKCTRLYEPGDILIRCRHCTRWYHGPCEGHNTEEDCENASENAFRCSLCRPKVNTYQEQYAIVDNVTITRSGLELFPQLRRDPSSMSFNEIYRPDQEEYDNEDGSEMNFGVGPRGGRARGGGPGRRVGRIGVGGFVVRIPRHRLLAEYHERENRNEMEEDGQQTKQRKQRKPRRPKLEEAYPPQIQEAFFGRPPVESRTLLDISVEEPVLGEHFNLSMEDRNSKIGTELPSQTADALRQMEERDLLGIFGIDDIDDDLDFNLDEENLDDQLGIDEPINNHEHDFDNIENVDVRAAALAQMEQNHAQQLQLQQQARMQMGQATGVQPNPCNPQAMTNKVMVSAAGQPSQQERINQATERWEEDEPLGDKATKAAVLYANIEHPELKTTHPKWADRVKVINRYWRQLDQTERQKYVSRARDNRQNQNKTRPKTKNEGVSRSMDDPEASRDSMHMDTPGPSEQPSHTPLPQTPVPQPPQMQIPPRTPVQHMPVSNGHNGQMHPQTPQTPHPVQHNQMPSQQIQQQQHHQMQQQGYHHQQMVGHQQHPQQQHVQQQPLPAHPPMNPQMAQQLGNQPMNQSPTVNQPMNPSMNPAIQQMHPQHQGQMMGPPRPPQGQFINGHPQMMHTQMVQIPPGPAQFLGKLPQPEIDKYMALRKELYNIEMNQKRVEEELSRLRKIKKNLNARRRNVQKNFKNYQEHPNPNQPCPPEDLSENDQQELASAGMQVTHHQKTNEGYRQKNKDITNKLVEMETKFQLPEHKNIPFEHLFYGHPQMDMHPEAQNPMVQQQMMAYPYGHGQEGLQSPSYHQNMAPQFMESPPNPAVHLYRQQSQYMNSPTTPNHPNLPQSVPNTPGFYGNPSQGLSQNQFNQPNGVRVPAYNQQVRQLVSPDIPSSPTTPASGRPGSSASMDPTPKAGRGRKKKKIMLPTDETRTPVMGGVAYNRLDNEQDREVYNSLDLVINWVTLAVESGTETLMKKLSTLKVSEPFDEHFSPFNVNVVSENPKQKKKRTVTRKPQSNDTNEFEMFADKLQSQLSAVIIPPLQYENNVDNSIRHFSDVSKFRSRNGEEFMDGSEIGQYVPKFMDDYYDNLENRNPSDDTSIYPKPMQQIYEDVNAHDLTVSECEIEEEMIVDEDEKNEEEAEKTVVNSNNMDNFNLKWRSICSDSIGENVVLPLLMKPSERTVPIEPHKLAFQKQKMRIPGEKFKVELHSNIEMNESTLNELREVLGYSGDINVKVKKEPEDMEISTSSNHENQNGNYDNKSSVSTGLNSTTSFSQSTDSKPELKCKYCDKVARLDEERVINFINKCNGKQREAFEQFKHFCSIKCFFLNAVDNKTFFHLHVITAAAEYVDEHAVAKLRDVFNKTVHLENRRNYQEQINRLSQSRDGSQQSNNQFNENLGDNITYPYLYQNNIHGNHDLVIKVSEMHPLGTLKPEELPKGEYKWKGEWWKIYDTTILQSFERPQDEVRQKFAALQQQLNPQGNKHRIHDERVCAFCSEVGDGPNHLGGRLLNLDANEWVHVNCAMWSSEVFENNDGALMNVEAALLRAKETLCKVCSKKGASLRCYKVECGNHETGYHLLCAKKTKGQFTKDKMFICANHHEVRPEMCVTQWDNLRRIYIDRDENQLLAKIFNHSYTTDMIMRVGNLIFKNLGQLLPEQLKNFHTEAHIFPLGYKSTRLFWSPINVNELTRYECTISEADSAPMFHVDFLNTGSADKTMNGAWSKVFNAVQQHREKARSSGSILLRFYPALMDSMMLTGLSEPAVTKMTESLPGVDQLYDYVCKNHGTPILDLPLAINPTGCARCEPHSKTAIKHRHRTVHQSPVKVEKIKKDFNPEIISRESRRTRTQRNIYTMDIDPRKLELMMKSGYTHEMIANAYTRYDPTNIHNAHSQYRKMKQEWRSYVYPARSKIQGLGLYARKDIDMHTMIIEYVGEVIRSEVCEVREKKYLSQNRGTYMFRIDDELVIDATMTGSMARYINHSCDPNCFTKRFKFNDEEKIVIVSNRPIKKDEELCYDYMFELEDDTTKVPCLCGAPNCNKWMN